MNLRNTAAAIVILIIIWFIFNKNLETFDGHWAARTRIGGFPAYYFVPYSSTYIGDSAVNS